MAGQTRRKSSYQNRIISKGIEEFFNNHDKEMEKSISKREIKEISINNIEPNPYQPRKSFNEEALYELAESIKQNGVFSPVLLTIPEDGIYTLVAGERRLRASKLAQKDTIPAIVSEYTVTQLLELALLENIQREDLTQVEIAVSLNAMIEKLGYTQEQAAERIGKSREYVTNILRLLQLPDEVQQKVVSRELSAGHARSLLGLKDEEQIIGVMDKIIEEKMNVRETETFTKELKERNKEEKKENEIIAEKIKRTSPYDKYVPLLKELLGYNNICIKGKEIRISFYDEEDIEEIIKKLQKM